MRPYATALLLVATLSACASAPQDPARSDWAHWPKGIDVGEVSAVDVDSRGNVYVLHRPGRPWAEPFPAAPIETAVVTVFDSSGRFVTQWGAGETVMPHGLTIAPDGTVWITDDQREQLLRFTADGKLLGTLGERGRSGTDLAHFGRPTDIAFAGGEMMVSDGYTNSRIIVLGPQPHSWGKAGTDADGFRVPHSVAVNGATVIVADRENSRIKILDMAGRVLRIIATPGHPYAAKSLPGGRLLVLEGRDGSDRQGAVLRLFGADGNQITERDIAPAFGPTRGHDLAVAADGTIYVADVAGHRLLVTSLAELTGK